MENKKRVYISGGITKRPVEVAVAHFMKAEEHLRGEGYNVFNPVSVKLSAGKDRWEDYMKYDVRELMVCDAIYMLKGWQSSRGALIEFALATVLGIEVLKEEGGDL